MKVFLDRETTLVGKHGIPGEFLLLMVISKRYATVPILVVMENGPKYASLTSGACEGQQMLTNMVVISQELNPQS